MRFVNLAVVCACVSLAACGGWKSGQANSAQGNISTDSRPPATAKASVVSNSAVPNAMVLLAVPVSRDRALALMKARHDGMAMVGDATKAIHRALGGTPDITTLRANAAKIVMVSRAAGKWFPAGTGPDVGKTRAKPDIWLSHDDFAAKLRNFQAAAIAFSAATHGNDVAAMNARFADLGGTCKACHEKYRSEEKH